MGGIWDLYLLLRRGGGGPVCSWLIAVRCGCVGCWAVLGWRWVGAVSVFGMALCVWVVFYLFLMVCKFLHFSSNCIEVKLILVFILDLFTCGVS